MCAKKLNRFEFERRKLGLSQKELAKMLGYSHTLVSQAERGYINPYKKFRKLCSEFFCVPEEELFPNAVNDTNIEW